MCLKLARRLYKIALSHPKCNNVSNEKRRFETISFSGADPKALADELNVSPHGMLSRDCRFRRQTHFITIVRSIHFASDSRPADSPFGDWGSHKQFAVYCNWEHCNPPHAMGEERVIIITMNWVRSTFMLLC